MHQNRIENDIKRHSKWVKEYKNLMQQQRDTNIYQKVGKKMKKKMMKQGLIKGYKG